MISIIVAMDKNRVIGRGSELLWHLSEDLKRFKSLTTGHAVIMGRKTYESVLKFLGKPLPDRTNIIVTHQRDYQASGCHVTHSLEEALIFAGNEEVFIIGGAEIYRQTIQQVDRLYVTLIDHEYDGDVLFPKIDEQSWEMAVEEKGENLGKQFPYEYWFRIYDRR